MWTWIVMGTALLVAIVLACGWVRRRWNYRRMLKRLDDLREQYRP
jgi:hypothetical protein